MPQIMSRSGAIASLLVCLSLSLTGCGTSAPPANPNGDSGARVDPGPPPEGLSEPDPEEAGESAAPTIDLPAAPTEN